MIWLEISCILLSLLLEGCVAFDVTVDGYGAVSRKKFCKGENVTFMCRNPPETDSFTWSVSNNLLDPENGSISAINSSEKEVGFFTLVASKVGSSSMSSLKLSVDDDLLSQSEPDLTITCTGSSAPPQSTTISLGQFSSPNFTVSSTNDYKSFMVRPSTGQTSCAHKYRVRVTDNKGKRYKGAASDTDFQRGVDLRNILQNAEDINICRYNYTVEVEGEMNGVVETTTVEARNIDYSTIGKLYNFLVDNDALRWSVPSILSGCIRGYQIYYHKSKVTKYMDSPNNYLPRTSLPSDVCKGETTISPVIATQDEPLHSSRIQTNVCESRHYHGTTESPEAKFRRELTLGLVVGIFGSFILTMVICMVCMIICHHCYIKKKQAEIESSYNRHVSGRPPPSYADTTRVPPAPNSRQEYQPPPQYPEGGTSSGGAESKSKDQRSKSYPD